MAGGALDATRAHLTATGLLPTAQLDAAKGLLAEPSTRPRRLIVACHYPLDAPPSYQKDLHHKRMRNATDVASWLATIGPHLFCCGHVHAAWAFALGRCQVSFVYGRRRACSATPTGLRPPGFLEITLHDRDVSVVHHAWRGAEWETRALYQDPGFFAATAG